MLVLAIILFLSNIFLMLFFFLKLSKKYSDTNIIKNIRKDANRLITDISFQTDKSITLIENKIKEATTITKQLEKTILLLNKEMQKNKDKEEILNNIETIKQQKQPANLKTTPQDSRVNNEPVTIYTKQILVPLQKNIIQTKNSFNRQIIEMAQKGLSVELIAEKVPLPKGEIELIISMNV